MSQTETVPAKPTRGQVVAKFGRRMHRGLPFPSDYRRHETRDCEAYRDAALRFLKRQGLREVQALRVVDECIAFAENRRRGTFED